VEGNFGRDAHVDPEVRQREQHLSVCGALAAVGDWPTGFRGGATTSDVEQRAINQSQVGFVFEIRADEDAREVQSANIVSPFWAKRKDGCGSCSRET
jgi:hypothetical protein